MQNNIILVNKKIGETPLEVIQKARLSNLKIANEKIAYAGRLDPMAKGLMILLIGEECKNRDFYQNMSKVYEFDLVLGIKTDTYDALGIIDSVQGSENIDIQEIQEIIPSYIGKIQQKYPPFSSFHVDGKPLYWFAREGLLNTINIPSKEVEINKLEVLGDKVIAAQDLIDKVISQINLVKGNFRQQEIIGKWVDKVASSNLHFQIVSMKSSVSSGTYIRSICNSIGDELGTGAIAMDINRVSVGKFKLSDII